MKSNTLTATFSSVNRTLRYHAIGNCMAHDVITLHPIASSHCCDAGDLQHEAALINTESTRIMSVFSGNCANSTNINATKNAISCGNVTGLWEHGLFCS